VIGATGSGINLDATQVEAVAAFLRVINALENVRESIGFLESFAGRSFLGNVEFEKLPNRALDEIDDAIMVLKDLQPQATAYLLESQQLTTQAIKARRFKEKRQRAREAIQELERARDQLVERP
jgi:hypothetical protein